MSSTRRKKLDGSRSKFITAEDKYQDRDLARRLTGTKSGLGQFGGRPFQEYMDELEGVSL